MAVIASANPAVKFEIDVENGQMGLSSISNDRDLAQETIDVEAEGESGIIAFNYHYIFGCLNALSKEKEITLELKSYSQAGIFKSYDKINYLYWLCRSASQQPPYDHVRPRSFRRALPQLR